MVATKLLRDPPKCTAPKPITQDFTKLRKSTFTFATSVSHWCTFKYSYQPDSSKVRWQSFNRWSKMMVKTRQSTYSDNQWFWLVFFQLHQFVLVTVLSNKFQPFYIIKNAINIFIKSVFLKKHYKKYTQCSKLKMKLKVQKV